MGGNEEVPIRKMEYLRYVAVLLILEQILVINIKSQNYTWISMISTLTLILVMLGMKLFKSALKTGLLFVLATAITAMMYYLKSVR
jgi:hypothetical protein